ncbi:hypothetical protein LCL97_04770 [Seohaeicola saemankumensis]|nr:hypothetical protein [Seohaeicola saemankumensis]MCA0870123.1 hypothetical protein [Seohaeicola saemankumensis]
MWIRAALLAALLPGAAAAQEPLSVIDWMRQGGTVQLPQTVLLEPPVAGSASRPEIEVSPLEELAAPVGLVSAHVTGLPVDLWRGSEVERLARLIAGAPVQHSPAMRTLLYTLLLSETRPPQGGAAADTLLMARIDRLMDLGAVDPAQALAELADPGHSADLFQRWFDAALLTGDEDRGCAMLAQAPHLSDDYAARIFCAARRGDWQTAALTLESAHALELLPPARLDLLDRFLSPDIFDGAPPLPAPEHPGPLDFRLYESIGERPPTASLPRAFATADLRDIAGWKAQLEAAERLTRYGALSPNRLLGLYTERLPAASGGLWDRVKAVQLFDAALNTGSAEAVAKTLPTVWASMREAGLAVPFAEIFAERLAVQRGLDPRSAALAWRIRLLAAGYEAASLRPPDNSVENTWLAALAQGDPQRALAPDPLAESITEGFRDPPSLPGDLQGAFDAGQLGEVILEVIALYDSGLSGNTGDMMAALSALRAIGLEDTARRAALQSVLLERG